jgi:tRNA A-37 threonylcarbamoyl transferase component Bud32
MDEAGSGGDEPTVRRDALIGTPLGEYTVLRRIGAGGMGIVYEGVHPVLGKRVAIKVLRPEMADSEDGVRRFIDEARAINAVQRHATVDVFSFGQVPDGRHYFVMEFLVGESLEELLARRQRLPIAEALPLLDALLDALAAIHDAGFIHRDLKPSNVFLAADGEGRRAVKILDFGLAKRASGEKWGRSSTAVAGTPDFMSPEQIRGGALTMATDLYALGCLGYEMLTGKAPFADAADGTQLLRAHLELAPPRPSSRLKEIPSAVDAFFLWLLAKEPAQRPASARVARDALGRVRSDLARAPRTPPRVSVPAGLVSAPPLAAPEHHDTVVSQPAIPVATRTVPVRKAKRGWIAVATIFLVSGAAAFAGLWWHGADAEPTETAATQKPPADPPTPEVPREPERKKTRTASAHPVPVPVAIPAGMGRLVLRTPPGRPELTAIVDGRPAVSTPQTLDLPPGKHVLTLSNPKARILILNYSVELTPGKILDPVPWLLEPTAHAAPLGVTP